MDDLKFIPQGKFIRMTIAQLSSFSFSDDMIYESRHIGVILIQFSEYKQG